MKKMKKESALNLWSPIVKIFLKIRMTEHTFMIIIAIIIGTLAGLGAIGIRAMIQLVSNLSFPGDGTLLDNIMGVPWYILIGVPTIGGILTGPLISFLAPEAKGSGVPEVIQSVLIEGGRIRPRVALIKSLASAITIGTGGSVGREGPIIQIGASLGSAVSQLFQISGIRIKSLVACGAAAGIAAAFNAPIAGTMFAVEIILMDFAVAQFTPIVISSVTATVISRLFVGDFVAFEIPTYYLISPIELSFYLVMGLLCGLTSYLFIYILFNTENLIDRYIRIPSYMKPALGGLLVGITALFFPQVMGVGYDSINLALHGSLVWELAAVLILAKIMATSFTLGSGGSGGIFAPSLFMGAMLGCAFGILMNKLFPDIAAPPGAYALVAMGGIVAGTTRAPITAIIMIFEITNTYDIILPLMITCIISAILSSKFSRESIYTMRLIDRNIHFKESAEINPMRSIFVRDVYTNRIEYIEQDMNFDTILSELFSRESPYLVVRDEKDRLLGTIFLNDLRKSYSEWEDLQEIAIAKDLVYTNFKPVMRHQDCQEALDRMIEAKMPGLPVVDRFDDKKVLGMIWQKDILDIFREEMSRKSIATTLLNNIQVRHTHQEVRFMQGRSIAEVSIPESFIGQSIRSLNIRASYQVEILSIHKVREANLPIDVFPDPGRVFAGDDEYMSIAGNVEMINRLKNLP
jgi:chloride channel protein, CIC family